MKVAVVGAGYAGLGLTWHLLQKGFDVTVFSNKEGASHASTGLLHPAPGKKAIPSICAEEGIAATLKLLHLAGDVFLQNGIMRIAHTPEQRAAFKGDRLWLPDGITVFSHPYLKALKGLCQKATFMEQEIAHLEDLKSFDCVIIAMGAKTPELIDLPSKKTIGQCLICKMPESLPYSFLSDCHITPTEDPKLCQIGSTYEHTDVPDPQKAIALLEKAKKIYPPAKNFTIVEIRSGTRIAPKVGYWPIVKRIDPKTWVFTGFGSRGLMYHAMLAESLANCFLDPGSSILNPW